MNQKIINLTEFIYGREEGGEAAKRIEALLDDFRGRLVPPSDSSGGFPLDQGDAFVITYGDQFRDSENSPLRCLLDFLDTFLQGTVRGVHILPFFPYSSDDGFSVVDFQQVHPEWGSWGDIEAISENYRFMADLVINHCSRSNSWFEGFLRGERPYRDYFIAVPPDTDVSAVFRPRTHPLLTEFETAGGKKSVWTTFSDDQVDLNFANPELLLEMIKILLFYIEKGVRVVRLDAIAFLWKELGTACLHHPKTHGVVKLLRAVIEEVCPWVVLITETNVPHRENLSYFGGGDEAHMVYQFALPPLLLDAFLRGDSGHLQEWAAEIRSPGPGQTFFNFCASHDGVGVLPARGILSEEELTGLLKSVEERGGFISYKSTPEGEIPYELNINYFSAVAEVSLSDSSRIKKFLASQSILLALPGVPGIYVHSLIGSENYREGVAESGIKRRINRQKFDYAEVQDELSTPGTVRALVFEGYENLLTARTGEKAFHPMADSRVIPTAPEVFALLRERRAEDGPGKVLCLVNMTYEEVDAIIDTGTLGMTDKYFTDLLSGDKIYPAWENPKRFSLELEPFETLWLAFERE
jgi:sucrose phosphorylase